MFKRKSEKGGSSPSRPSYPTQGAGYPTQPSASALPPAQPPPYNYVASAPAAAPPMYGPPGTQPYAYPGAPQGYVAPGAGAQYGMPPPGGGMYAPAPPPAGPQPSTYVVQGGFDAGARFDGISKPSIPPPPPGCAPNMAQMAAFQGHNVVVTQRPSGVWDSGSDGGFTLF